MNLHTAHHGKDESGRAPIIEGYIRQSVDFAFSNMGSTGSAVKMMDVGADYGYAMHYAATTYGAQVWGLEPYTQSNVWGLNIMQGSVEDPALQYRWLAATWPKVDLLFLNHVLEHFCDPHVALMNLRHLLKPDGWIFVATPEANSEWALWDGHLSIYTRPFTDYLMNMHGFMVEARDEKEFRPGNVELWTLARSV